LGHGLISTPEDVEALWRRQARFDPVMAAGPRDGLLAGWNRAVKRALSDS